MKAFVGHVDLSGLRYLVAEDMLPAVLLDQLVRGWASRSATVFRAIIDEDAAKAIRHEIAQARLGTACGLLLNRAVELVPLRPSDDDRPI